MHMYSILCIHKCFQTVCIYLKWSIRSYRQHKYTSIHLINVVENYGRKSHKAARGESKLREIIYLFLKNCTKIPSEIAKKISCLNSPIVYHIDTEFTDTSTQGPWKTCLVSSWWKCVCSRWEERNGHSSLANKGMCWILHRHGLSQKNRYPHCQHCAKHSS